jgi:multiple antibiotic resistance protein
MILWKSFLLAFTALLPLTNPVGSALIFLGLVGDEPTSVFLGLARRIAFSTVAFLIAIEFLGSVILWILGLSLPVVQVAGGLIIVALAWTMLFERDVNSAANAKHQEIAGYSARDNESVLADKIFYPFTFPVTAGPGTLVVVLALSVRAEQSRLPERISAYAGIALAAVVLSVLVYLCYGYAPKLITKVSPATIHGTLRVIAFILMCIGVQIAWKGFSLLYISLPGHQACMRSSVIVACDIFSNHLHNSEFRL